MRLLNIKTLEFRQFRAEKPNYVAASHRWAEDETSFKDVRKRRNIESKGYKKVEAFARFVRERVIGVEWLWIDTCCINQEDAAELSESINLMFDWYENAVMCVAYLADVDGRGDLDESVWFQRGWTLQELLAPQIVVFVTKGWQILGNKGGFTSEFDWSGPSLEGDLARITGIPKSALSDCSTCLSFSVEEKFKWMQRRNTTRPEDMSYCLYGLLGVTLGANYGEKHEGARERLLRVIQDRENKARWQAEQQHEQFSKIAAWLSAPDPWTNHQSARQVHEPETGNWLFQSDQYRDWIAGTIPHLHVYGKAGCGKTVLCSTAIEGVEAHCERRPHAAFAVFYFSFSDDRKQGLTNLLLSLVTQLGWKNPARSTLQEAFNKANKNGLGVNELETVLITSLNSNSETFLLLDALDECPEDDDIRQSVLDCLDRLKQVKNVRIFTTSRDLPDIHASIARLNAQSVIATTRAVDEDIRLYVKVQIWRDPRLSRLHEKTKTLIEETISAKADGMFRWAYCQLQVLKKLKSTRPTFVRNALHSLPPTLDKTYERMLLDIDAMLRKDALTLLRWLAYARTPLSLGQLADATVIDLDGDGHVNMDDRPGLDDTLKILSGLVTNTREAREDDYTHVKDVPHTSLNGASYLADIELQDSRSEDEIIEPANDSQRICSNTQVRLAHSSVKEYLESKRILGSCTQDFHFVNTREHGILSQSCVVYLTYYSRCNKKLSTKQDLVAFPLLRYAAETWIYHATARQAAETISEAPIFFNEDILRDWTVVYRPEKVLAPFRYRTDPGSGLYYASLLGFEIIVRKLLTAGSDVNAHGGFFGNPLQAAIESGHEEVVRMLLDAGADVNPRTRKLAHLPLRQASVKGNEKIVQMLLDAGADKENFSIALSRAAGRGHKKVVQLLLDAGADVNARWRMHHGPLHAAIIAGRKEIVQTLVDAGAHVNEPSNPLLVASARGQEEIVRILIDAGASVNPWFSESNNPLHMAANEGHENVVRVLLHAGADIHAWSFINGKHTTPLQTAVSRGHENVVRVLLDAGASVNIRRTEDGEYWTPL